MVEMEYYRDNEYVYINNPDGTTKRMTITDFESMLNGTDKYVRVDPTLTQSGQAADAKVTGDEVSDLKEDLRQVDPLLFDMTESTNIYTPTSTRVYPNNGTAVINADKSITISNVPQSTTVWISAQDSDPITLEAGEYTLCIDEGLLVYGTNNVSLQEDSSGSYAALVTATGTETKFAIESSITALFRISVYSGASATIDSWSGHIWINKGDAQPYMPVGETAKEPKELVYMPWAVDRFNDTLTKEIYQRGNLIDWDEVTKGYIKADGSVYPYETLWCSGFMPVEQGKIYCTCAVVQGNILYSNYFAFYDENKTLVASQATLGNMTKMTGSIYYIDVPSNAKYFRCTFGTDPTVVKKSWVANIPETPPSENLFNTENVFPYTLNPANPCDYSELTVRAFSKVVCIGDSLTYGGFNLSNSGSATGETQSSAELALRYSYPSNFQRITGVETVNAGDSGETSVSWYQQHQNDDFSQFDLAIIHLGVNDSAFSVSDADTLTAMQNIVTMLNNARSDMKIAICSVIPAYEGTGYQAKGQLILNWAKGLNNPNIIPLDIAKYSHVQARTSYVSGHLSALGYYMMALDIARYISWYMDQHKRDFRFIQFIGSPDATYSGD